MHDIHVYMCMYSVHVIHVHVYTCHVLLIHVYTRGSMTLPPVILLKAKILKSQRSTLRRRSCREIHVTMKYDHDCMLPSETTRRVINNMIPAWNNKQKHMHHSHCIHPRPCKLQIIILKTHSFLWCNIDTSIILHEIMVEVLNFDSNNYI